MFVKMRGVRKYLWRAVDQHGIVLEILIQDKGKAAAGFFWKIVKEQARSATGTDHRQTPQLRVAHRTTMSTVEHRETST